MFNKVQKAVGSVSLLKGCIQQEQQKYDFLFIKQNDKRRAFEKKQIPAFSSEADNSEGFSPSPFAETLHFCTGYAIPCHNRTIMQGGFLIESSLFLFTFLMLCNAAGSHRTWLCSDSASSCTTHLPLTTSLPFWLFPLRSHFLLDRSSISFSCPT